jgi:hypothetical protein
LPHAAWSVLTRSIAFLQVAKIQPV